MSRLRAWLGLSTFRHGVHPHDAKEATRGQPIERAQFVDTYVLPLGQHIGAPARALVSRGQRVQRGQRIAEAVGFVSTALHAPVTGTVEAIELRPHPNGQKMEAVVIQADPYSSQELLEKEPEDENLVRRIQNAGIVGLGGAAFPSHVKLEVPEGKRVRFVILNGCECEPYLTCDHRVMLERPDAVLRGLSLMMDRLGGERAYIGLEANKDDAAQGLRQRAKALDFAWPLDVVALEVKYPQGAEKMLIDAVLDLEIPSGKLPLDLEIVVNNVATAAAFADLADEGLPLIERVLTVSGPGVRRPANVLVPLGTPVRSVLDHCGGLRPEARQVIIGGPMMGMAQKDLDVPVLKGTSGILVLNEVSAPGEEYACIRCGRCLEACPMFLNPSRLASLVRAERPDELIGHHIRDCFECASCSFVCPSNIPLVQLMRVGKAMARKSS